jgi:FAD/FMN-containing dehydrogenase
MITTLTTDGLRSALRGRLIAPDDEGYEEERKVWNGMIDRRPALIVKCEGTADVITCLDFARSNDLPITVRGGGHSVAGKAVQDGAMLIDLSNMRAVDVDRKHQTARVGAGATWGVVDHETQAFGLAVTGGVDSRTGVAGLTLGGGVGYLARPYGLSIDHLLSAEVVLADGSTVIASEDDHPDLFWALRGGGGNFGVVTAFEFRLNYVGPEVMTAQVFHTLDGAAEALSFFRDYMSAAPDPVGCYALFIKMPQVEPFPEELHGQTTLALVACHPGGLEEGEADLAPLANFGTPVLSVLAPMPYTALQSSFDAAAPDGGRYYWKAQYMDDLSDEAIATMVDMVDPLPGPYSNVFIEALEGAVARVDPAATAFPHRSAPFSFGISSGWADPAQDDAAISWTRRLYDRMTPFSSGGVYSNYVDRDETDRVVGAYGANLRRLQKVKAKYDPDNRFNQANQALLQTS